VLVEPSISPAPRVDVQHIDAGDHASGDANQLTWVGAKQSCDALRVRDCIFVTVGRGGALIGSAWKDVEARPWSKTGRMSTHPALLRRRSPSNKSAPRSKCAVAATKSSVAVGPGPSHSSRLALYAGTSCLEQPKARRI
jgi:hypothetical protein